MNIFIAVLASGIAAFIWLFFFRIIDHFKPEKWWTVLLFFALGGLSVLVPAFTPDLLETDATWDGILLDNFLNVALVEESGKFLMVLLGLLLFPKLFTDGPNYLIFGASVGIGFGFVENVLYAMNYGNLVLHFRDIISLTLHAFCSGIIAYGLYRFKTGNKGELLLWYLTSLLIHGLFNSGIEMGDISPLYIVLSYCFYLIAIEFFALMMNNVINLSHHFEDHVPFPAKAIRISMSLTFVLLFVLFMVMYMFEYGPVGIGVFLFLSSPLLVLVYVTINRLSSLVLVKGKVFPVSPSFPFLFGGLDLGLPGLPRTRMTVKGLPYYELPFVSRINLETPIRPINKHFDYFGSHALIRITGKVYAKSQIIFYPLQFISSDDPVSSSKFYYLMPKFSGEKEMGNKLIVALVCRDKEIDSSTEDAGTGGFCAWIYLEKEPELPVLHHFFRLVKD